MDIPVYIILHGIHKMPDSETHRIIAKRLGLNAKKAREIDKLIDGPVKFLGNKHRILFHDPKQLAMLSIVKGDPKILPYGMVHVALDNACSKNKKLANILKLLN